VSQIEKIRKILLAKLKCYNSPQLINAPLLSKQLKGNREYCNWVVYQLKNSGMVTYAGSVRDSHFYFFNRTARGWLNTEGEKILSCWIYHGKHWDKKWFNYTEKDFVKTNNLMADLGYEEFADYNQEESND